MVASIAAGTTAQYYLSRTEYYLDDREPQGIWVAGTDFGITAGQVVQADLFERLHGALDENGRSLLTNDGNRVEQVGGYDITFSSPKSMSLLWGIADGELREQLEAVQLSAVQTAIRMLDENAAYCRRGHGGQHLERVSLSVAAFQHGEARPALHSDGQTFADCALHTHAICLSLATRADGSVGRIDGRVLFAWKMAAGALYHRALAQGLRELGFGIEVTGTNGIFEVAGVDPELCAYFSARRQEITDELAELGITTADAPALAAAKALTTRQSKRQIEGIERHEFWRDKCRELGHAPEQIVERARTWKLDRSIDLDRTLDEAEPASTLLNDVLAQLTERASTFERRHLVAAVAAALVEDDGTYSLADALARLEQEDRVVTLAEDAWGHAIYSTPEVIALEQGLFARAEHIAAIAVDPPPVNRVEQLLGSFGLNPEQAAAARSACAARALSIIEGGPGVGKTTLLAPVAQVWQDHGWRVIGASTAWKIANQLHDDLGIESRAVDSWIARAEHDQKFLTDKTVLLVDEAGLMTSKQMDRLLVEVESARRAGRQVAVRLIGDRRQLQPIGGPGLRIVADALGVERVDTIVRQRHQWAREAVTALGQGKAADALAAFSQHDNLHLCASPREAVTQLANAWDRHCAQHGEGTALMIAKSNRQVLALNAAARALLRARGQIDNSAETTFEASTPSGQTHSIALVPGDLVRFLQRNDALGVINGTIGTVVQVNRTGLDQTEIVVKVGSRKVRFSPEEYSDDKARLQLVHAYATTCYGAQGLTTEQAFVLAEPTMDRHDIFVAASRAREATHLFVDRKALDVRVKAKRLLSERGRAVDDDERLFVLSSAFSTSRLKLSTLDYLKPTQQVDRVAETKLVRTPSRELSRE